MQDQFSCVPTTYARIETTLSSARLGRYLPAANGDKHLAFRLYLWNARLCEAMYYPIQTAEVAARNAIQGPLLKRFGDRWFEHAAFANLLPPRLRDALADCIAKERQKRGAALDCNHIVAGLSFGFWVTLMTASYDKHLWANGVRFSFPNAPPQVGRREIHSMLEDMRELRNDVMHHIAIFDRGPQKRYRNVLHIIEMICSETHWLVGHLSRLNQVINERPRV